MKNKIPNIISMLLKIEIKIDQRMTNPCIVTAIKSAAFSVFRSLRKMPESMPFEFDENPESVDGSLGTG